MNVFGNKIKICSTDGSKVQTIEDSVATKITFAGFEDGNFVYIDDANNIKTISYYNCMNNKSYQIETIAKVESINVDNIDLDETYVYFYKTVNEKNYLFRVNNNSRYVEGETQDEMVGVYLEEDIPEEAEKEE